MVTPLQPVSPVTTMFTFCLNDAGFGIKLTCGIPEHDTGIVVVVVRIVVVSDVVVVDGMVVRTVVVGRMLVVLLELVVVEVVVSEVVVLVEVVGIIVVVVVVVVAGFIVRVSHRAVTLLLFESPAYIAVKYRFPVPYGPPVEIL